MTATSNPRKCVTCGLVEARRPNARGQIETNLSPLTTQCVDCLIATVREARTMQGSMEYRRKAAHDE